MTCRLSSDSPHLMPCGSSPGFMCNASHVIAWRREQCPTGHRSDAQGDHLQAIDSPHESDALQNICGAEVGQERRLIQWQGGNCVVMGPAPHARARRVLIRR